MRFGRGSRRREGRRERAAGKGNVSLPAPLAPPTPARALAALADLHALGKLAGQLGMRVYREPEAADELRTVAGVQLATLRRRAVDVLGADEVDGLLASARDEARQVFARRG